ncbi:hypothetical protein GCK32_017216 [Trichostrongylus colubriformis]|uniref:Uncharacterized protein n=1 Tax=Trichostrongylus colubriformis TaxID=6319 RepID=A0AAN8FJM1_TRICO
MTYPASNVAIRSETMLRKPRTFLCAVYWIQLWSRCCIQILKRMRTLLLSSVLFCVLLACSAVLIERASHDFPKNRIPFSKHAICVHLLEEGIKDLCGDIEKVPYPSCVVRKICKHADEINRKLEGGVTADKICTWMEF